LDKIPNAAYSYPGSWRSWLSRGCTSVDGDEDGPPIRRSTARPGQTRGGLTGRICIDCCALEHLSTFHHCTFFTRLSILKNGFKTSFFEYKTAVRFESRSAGLGTLYDESNQFLFSLSLPEAKFTSGPSPWLTADFQWPRPATCARLLATLPARHQFY
jgi:hypothetical protein